MSTRDLLIILAGYVFGSIPFSYLITKAATGKDVRLEGEGNVGSRNAMHIAGMPLGVLAALLDIGKGAGAYWLATLYGTGEWTLYLTAAAAVLGHGFPVWLGWRGGKGLAVVGGFLIQMWPKAAAVSIVLLLISALFVPDFNLRAALAFGSFPFLTIVEGTTVHRFVFTLLILTLAGIKKLIDLPHEREIRAKSGWFESLEHVRARKGGECPPEVAQTERGNR